jgi:ubiquinone/menaquinone biosynthesis C-methylase UbiE
VSYVRDTQEFFEARAAGWEDRFPDDDALFEAAVAELGPIAGSRVLDVGCGTGRALPFIRNAVGLTGLVVGADLTPGMINEAARRGRGSQAQLLVADVMRLPFSATQFDVVFAAGLLPHLIDPLSSLMELARVTARGGELAIFHPIGRVALAARHGGTPSDDDTLAPARLRYFLDASGWAVEHIDDGVQRYLALASRTSD